jgi:minor extracellular serine protease Vpr
VRRMLLLFVALATLSAFAVPGAAQVDLPERADRTIPDSIDRLKLDSPVSASGVDPAVVSDEGPQRLIVRLVAPSVSEQELKGAAARRAKSAVEAEQDDLLDRILAVDPDARVLARTQLVLNAVFVEVSPEAVSEIVEDPSVLRVAHIGEYQLDLSETVPYIGGTDVHAAGYDGTGVRVAVLDSGVDYYHAALGGSGDPADYAADDPTIIEPGTFPTDKVVGGYDFVGATWPDTPEMPDPDPLDDGPEAGHGTHVAHIIAGDVEYAASGIYPGVAPGAEIYAVKVCSSISTACSGLALIQGMEFAVDPDGDGDPADRVDIINMSLGAPYGQPFDDDLSAAVDGASALGVLTVASAGNSGDKPYATGTPSATDTALAVAQTAVPSDILPQLQVIAPEEIAGLYNAVFQPWSVPPAGVIEAPLMYGDGAGGNLLGCDPFPAGSLAGHIVLVDRGACNFTLKIKNIGEAGGLAGLIGLVAPGDPFTGGDGGDRPITIPGYMISQADSSTFKSGLPETMVRIDPAVGLPMVGTMIGSSSRGPQNSIHNVLKPEIGAPGASISAIAGSGTATGPFGGTSGAAPMVSGSAALLMQAAPGLSPAEVKAKLMNTGDTGTLTEPEGPLAPVSRIGGGEVRVDAAVAAPAAAWADDRPTAALSFGLIDVAKKTSVVTRTVRVRNYSDSDVTYSVGSEFRYADDEASGAVTLQTPSKVKVKAGKDATFTVKMTIRGDRLGGNVMNSGSAGADPGALTATEYDGYVVLDDGENPIHLPWHVLPRKAAEVKARQTLTFEGGVDTVSLNNIGVGTAQNDAYALIATSPDIPEGDRGEQSPTPDIRAVGVNTFPVPANFCSTQPSFVWAFAVNTWERQAHLLPVSHQIWLDTNQDGVDDYVVLNRDASGLGTISDGRQLAWALNLETGAASAFFFAEHSTNTGNTALYICAEQVGLTGTDMLATNVDVDVVAQDFYFGGPGDAVEDLTITPLGERYLGIPEDLAGGSDGVMDVIDFGPFPGNTDELGVMLFTNGDRGAGNRGGATQDTEAMLFLAK